MQDENKELRDSPNTDNEVGGQPSLTRRQKTDYLYDLEAHDEYIVDYDGYEAMLIGRTFDAVSRETKQGITDGSAATLYIERAARVVGQLPTGEVKAAGRADAGKGALLDILRQKHIYPNANAQQPFLNKVRMWQLYSSVYGNMPMFVDWHVSPTGYIGPDCWLWNPRNFIPQNGRTTINDMDYCHAIAYVTEGYIEDLLEEDDEAGWNKENLEAVLKLARESSLFNDVRRDTLIKRDRTFQAVRGLVPFATRYEAGEDGHWVTFCPLFGYRILRDTPNPHKSNRIPFFNKPGLPLFDSYYGLGDFQRAQPLQFALDGLTNFYFEGIKMNIYQPTVVNANGVVKSSIDQRPGAIWMETVPNSVRRLETSTAGLSTYQAAVTQLKAALQSQAGSTDTTMGGASAMDPAFGKTPQALQYLNQRESTRDNQDRFYLEQALEDMIDYMLQLYVTVGTESTDISIFADEIKDIESAGYMDIIEALDISKSGQSASLKIKPSAFKDLTVNFQLDAGTTKSEDNAQKKGALDDWFAIIGKMPTELEAIRNQGKQIDWEAAFNMYGQFSGVPEMDKLWIPVTPQEQQQEQQQMQAESITPDTPHIDYRIMGDMDPQQVASVMGGSGNQTPPGQMAPMSPQHPGPEMAQPVASPNQLPPQPMHAGPVANPPQAPPQAPPQQMQRPGVAAPHPVTNSQDPLIRQAAMRMEAMKR